MKLSLNLTEQESQQLAQTASELGVEPEQLAHSAVIEMLNKPKEDFQKIAERVVEKNKELYKRLS